MLILQTNINAGVFKESESVNSKIKHRKKKKENKA
jgi:hypothetical protein